MRRMAPPVQMALAARVTAPTLAPDMPRLVSLASTSALVRRQRCLRASPTLRLAPAPRQLSAGYGLLVGVRQWYARLWEQDPGEPPRLVLPWQGQPRVHPPVAQGGLHLDGLYLAKGRPLRGQCRLQHVLSPPLGLRAGLEHLGCTSRAATARAAQRCLDRRSRGQSTVGLARAPRDWRHAHRSSSNTSSSSSRLRARARARAKANTRGRRRDKGLKELEQWGGQRGSSSS